MSYLNFSGAFPTDLINPNQLYGASIWPPSNCNSINSGDTSWMITSTALVFFMTPGLAFFYGGLVHRKSVLTIMMQCFISLGVVTLIWFLLGFGLAYGETAGHIIGNPASFPLFLNMDFCTPAGYPMAGATLTIPALLFAGYQLMFAIITPALITGAVADRIQFVPYLIFLAFWVILVYCPFAHWLWNPQGFFALWGCHDFAGGIVVHISAGFASLACIAMTGNRAWESDEERIQATVPHNRTFVALGAGMLWFGWFGFNGGSAYSASGGQAVFASINSCIAASTAMCSWVLVEWIHMRKPSIVGACVGCVAGLATITPAAGFVRPWAAFLLGGAAGPFCYGCVELRKMFSWDDALDVWGVHGMGGFFGAVMIGALADEEIGGFSRSGLLFGKQLACCVWCAFYTFTISYLLLKIINMFTPVLPTKDQVREGLDVSLHGEYAYDDDAVKFAKQSLLNQLKSDFSEQRIAELFHTFDNQKKGAIDRNTFKAAMKSIGVTVPDEVILKIHKEADADQSGGIDLREFVNMFNKLREEENKLKEPAAPVGTSLAFAQPSGSKENAMYFGQGFGTRTAAEDGFAGVA